MQQNVKKIVFEIFKSVAVHKVSQGRINSEGLGWGGDFEKFLRKFVNVLLIFLDFQLIC